MLTLNRPVGLVAPIAQRKPSVKQSNLGGFQPRSVQQKIISQHFEGKPSALAFFTLLITLMTGCFQQGEKVSAPTPNTPTPNTPTPSEVTRLPKPILRLSPPEIKQELTMLHNQKLGNKERLAAGFRLLEGNALGKEHGLMLSIVNASLRELEHKQELSLVEQEQQKNLNSLAQELTLLLDQQEIYSNALSMNLPPIVLGAERKERMEDRSRVINQFQQQFEKAKKVYEQTYPQTE